MRATEDPEEAQEKRLIQPEKIIVVKQASHPSLFYPPGGLLIWIVIYLELITFGVAMVVLAYSGAADRAAFHHESQMLDRTIGAINTVFLMTSGFLVAQAVQFFRQKNTAKTAHFLLWSVLAGGGFLILKLVEYSGKLEAGLDMSHSTFFMFYWLLTGFHWVHVLVGMVILWALRRTVIRKKRDASLDDLEAGAAFWHMCDLLWLLLFPILYLLF